MLSTRAWSAAAIPQGTLDVRIQTVLARAGERQGFAIAEAIEQASSDAVCVDEGSLNPALPGLLVEGWA